MEMQNAVQPTLVANAEILRLLKDAKELASNAVSI